VSDVEYGGRAVSTPFDVILFSVTVLPGPRAPLGSQSAVGGGTASRFGKVWTLISGRGVV